LDTAKAAGCRRFAPSEFGIGIQGTPRIDMLAGNMAVWEACEKSGLEWTRFENGLFMNYLGFGAPAERREEALGGREAHGEGEWMFFVTERRAELPVKEDGTFLRISITAMEDIGAFVARSLELEKWEDTMMCCVGETLRVDEVVRICEKYTGGAKWDVKTVRSQEYEDMIAKERDEGKKLWLQLGLEPTLNRNFAEIKPLCVEDFMKKYYE
jgi:NmrA-like family